MRRQDGREAWNRLLEWDKGQTPAERLAAVLLKAEGFQNVDPSHPLGGKDGLKDISLSFEGKKWICGVYYPRGQKDFSIIKRKFLDDIEGLSVNEAKGFIFFTNQELRLSERKILSELVKEDIEIYHLERVASLLNNPQNYGIRLEFLGIEMSREEQVSFFNVTSNQGIERIEKMIQNMSMLIERNSELSENEQVNEKKDFVNFEDEDFDYEYDYDYEDDKPRELEEIMQWSEEFYEKIWFDRHLSWRYSVEKNGELVDSKIWDGANKAAKRVIEEYGEENLGPYSDFEWGMLNGKLSALRWVLGMEWDMLDT